MYKKKEGTQFKKNQKTNNQPLFLGPTSQLYLGTTSSRPNRSGSNSFYTTFLTFFQCVLCQLANQFPKWTQLSISNLSQSNLKMYTSLSWTVTDGSDPLKNTIYCAFWTDLNHMTIAIWSPKRDRPSLMDL